MAAGGMVADRKVWPTQGPGQKATANAWPAGPDWPVRTVTAAGVDTDSKSVGLESL